MQSTEDKSLHTVAAELRFIGRHVQTIECSRGCDFEAVDEIAMAVRAALDALEKHQSPVQPDVTGEGAGGGFIVTTYELVKVA